MELGSFAGLIERAEASAAAVRAAALMRIARLQSAFDDELGRRTFLRGLDAVRQLSGFDRDSLLEHARLLAAAVAPDLMPDDPGSRRSHRPFESDSICRVMIDHNHRDAAFDYSMNYPDPDTFPFGPILMLMQPSEDHERRLALLRRAIEAVAERRARPEE